MENEMREREIQIETLTKALESIQKELKDLKGAHTLASLVKENIFWAYRYSNSDRLEIRKTSYMPNDVWDPIRKLTMTTFREYKACRRLVWADLTREEKELAGEMASELVSVYNKYFRIIYADYVKGANNENVETRRN